ncbi:MAG: hypothetical protein M1825_003706 [Sarcosagium campestre]|nr:MAG: hypothetical protein M1825_003706 [Sarcosagium campestre]
MCRRRLTPLHRHSIVREDLVSPKSSRDASPSDDSLKQLLQSRLAHTFESVSYGPDTSHSQTRTIPATAADEKLKPDGEDEAFEFRMFRTLKSHPKSSSLGTTAHKPASHRDRTPNVQRVALRSPSPGPPGFRVSRRPLTYYFVGPASVSQKGQFQQSSVTAEQIFEMARRRWPGCAYAWCVSHLDARGQLRSVRQPPEYPSTTLGSHPTDRTLTENAEEGKQLRSGRRRKCRAGKKRRIATRKVVRAETEKRELQRRKQLSDREKKTRRNRDKQLKKRERDKLKKKLDQQGVEGQPAETEE